ncbi:MAG: cytochrome c [Saprospiraceae bacterium]|nr:cytochrome c [Saprospiraceae bacterium]
MSGKATLFTAFLLLAFFACTSKKEAEEKAKKSPTASELAIPQPEVHGTEIKSVELTNPLKAEWVSTGKSIYETKCLACHKLTDERVVGPGWAGVTKKRQPVWIMNMITNVDMMLETDAEAQKMLEECLVRMPNQNVSEEDARKILEFMRFNDGEK